MLAFFVIFYTRHTWSCFCVSCVTRPIRGPRPVGAAASSVQICSWQICHLPESLTRVSSSGCVPLPPWSNANYFGY